VHAIEAVNEETTYDYIVKYVAEAGVCKWMSEVKDAPSADAFPNAGPYPLHSDEVIGPLYSTRNSQFAANMHNKSKALFGGDLCVPSKTNII